MERKRIIVITPEEKAYLQNVFKVSDTTVYHAVTYRRSNEIHRKIRKAAIERGNPRMVMTPEFETIFLTNREDADERMTRYMIQPFANGAVLEVNRSTGLATVRDKHGDVRGEWHNPRISELDAIQEVAMKL